MAMTKRPVSKAKDQAAFIEQAPDTKPARWQRGSKTQITLSLAPDPNCTDHWDCSPATTGAKMSSSALAG